MQFFERPYLKTKLFDSTFQLLEEAEDIIEEWYFGDEKPDILDYLCRKRLLKGMGSCFKGGRKEEKYFCHAFIHGFEILPPRR